MDGGKEGNPIGHGLPVNQEELQDDPNDTLMWNARLVAPTLVSPAIKKPPIGADNWKIEGNFFTMIKDMLFHGLIEENPFEHIQQFNDICDIYKNKDVMDDAFKLRAFPFTLQGDANVWLRNLPSDSIRSFQDLTEAFINHFFPPLKAERLRMEINGFTQRNDESLYDAWIRIKKMLRAYPPHDLIKKEYINTFYRGTNALIRQTLDASSGGVFMYKSPNVAETMLEDMLVNTYEWNPSPRDLPRKSVAQVEKEKLNLEDELEIDTIDLGVFKFSDDSEVAEFIPYQVKNIMSIEATELTCKKLEGDFEKIKLGKVEKESKVEKVLNAKEHRNESRFLLHQQRRNVLENMPHYGKFLKPLMAKKEKVEKASTAFLKKECDGILKKCNLPPKMGLGDLSPTKMGVNLIDQSISFSVGIAEDLIVKVGEMEFSIDFVIVDIKEDPVVPLVLGRPFLSTAGSLFDFRTGKLTLRDKGKCLSIRSKYVKSSPTPLITP
ncbi:uncharacterized protein [Rutidosis leptorrhynchoides]|uniref:uncharacterized protein n=1 Tax=Rutidosis leptorrhynchoides TaxID=125765 RepID=UPI003A997772